MQQAIELKRDFEPIELYPKQKQLIDKIRGAFKSGAKMPCIQASTGFGKCHQKGTEILMHDGSTKKVENIVVGDKVMGADSQPRNILKLCRGTEEMYKIKPVKGNPFTVNKSHTLSLKVSGTKTKVIDCNGNEYKGGDIVNITVEDYLNSNKNFKHLVKAYRVGVEFDKARQTIDPYILGLWLADGTAKNVSITTMDKEVVEAWEKYASKFDYTSVRVTDRDDSKASNYHITRTAKHSQKYDFVSAHSLFKEANLIGNKHVPSNYKIASREQRLEFLAGILDGDGNLVGGNVFEITQKNKSIAEDIAFIARSLGMAAYISKKVGKIKETGFKSNYYRVCISGDTDEIPNRVERRKAAKRKQIKSVLVTGFSVEPVGIDNYYGFETDGDHLYLLSDFTVTHNSVVAGYIIKSALERGAFRVVMIVDSLTLIEQLVDTLENRFGLDVGVIQGFNERYDMAKKVQIATPQTLARRFDDEKVSRFYTGYQVDLVIVDECHLQYKGIREAMKHWKCRGMGLTATPYAKGMANTYDALVKADSMDKLIEDGDLAAYKVFSHKTPDFSGCKVSANGDIMADSVYTDDLIGDVYKTWKTHASDRLTIGFATTIAKCEAFARLFHSHGVPSVAIHSKMTDDDCRNIIEQFKAGRIRVLWSVAKLVKGFDVKEVSCMIDCQPTKSLMRHVQKVGRVLRKCEGKTESIILDHAGNFQNNGFVEDASIDELSDGSEKESKDRKDTKEPEPIKCFKCGHMMRPVIMACPECGHEREQKSKHEAPDDITTAEGELVEMTKAVTKRNRTETWEQKISFASGLKAYAHSKGFKKGWFAHKYKERYGVWPNDARVKNAPAGVITPEVKRFIQHVNIKRAKAKA